MTGNCLGVFRTQQKRCFDSLTRGQIPLVVTKIMIETATDEQIDAEDFFLKKSELITQLSTSSIDWVQHFSCNACNFQKKNEPV